MQKSTITIDVILDPNRIPEKINWQASDSTAEMAQQAKAMCLAFWDSAEKTALRIDLWTKDMMVDEMGDFYYQMMITMADSFVRSTKNEKLAAELKQFANGFYQRFRDDLAKEQ